MGRKRKDGDPFGLAGTRLAFKRGKFWYRHRFPERWENVGTDIAIAKKKAALYNDPQSDFGTVRYWMTLFLSDMALLVKAGKRSARTLADYQAYAEDGRPLMICFGRMLPEHIEPNHVQAFIDSGGRTGRATQANRERACLSSMLSWLLRQPNSGSAIRVNPCMQRSGVVRNEEKARERYVTHDEMREVMEVATRSERLLMLLTYRTLQRPDSDIIHWDTRDIVHDGEARFLQFTQNKTRQRIRIALGPELDALLPRRGEKVLRMVEPIVQRLDGEAYTYDGLASMLRRSIDAANARRAARKVAPMESFGFRDLKGKGATDMYFIDKRPIEEIQQLCGHSNKATTEKYIKARWREAAQTNAVNLGF